MNEPKDVPMDELIERSSLGSAEARRRRNRVSPATGRALAKAASERAQQPKIHHPRIQG